MGERHRIGESEWSRYTQAWWKLVIVGSILIAAVIIGAALGLDAWFVAFSAVMLACCLIAVGGVLGLAHLVARRRSVAR
jgi:hypothetical protein